MAKIKNHTWMAQTPGHLKTFMRPFLKPQNVRLKYRTQHLLLDKAFTWELSGEHTTQYFSQYSAKHTCKIHKIIHRNRRSKSRNLPCRTLAQTEKNKMEAGNYEVDTGEFLRTIFGVRISSLIGVDRWKASIRNSDIYFTKYDAPLNGLLENRNAGKMSTTIIRKNTQIRKILSWTDFFCVL